MEAGTGPGTGGVPPQGGGAAESGTGDRAPAAGWYPDPQGAGGQRWWDGTTWTEHVHPPAGAAPGGAQQHGGTAGGAQQYGGAPGGAQEYGAAPGGAQQYGGGPGAYPSAADPAWMAARADADARQWAMFAHLSALAALITGLPWLGPLIIYLVKRNDHPFIAEHAREALNFNISVFIYMVVAGFATFLLLFILVGFLLIPVLIGIAIAWLVFLIIAATRANAGQPYRYPLTIRMVT